MGKRQVVEHEQRDVVDEAQERINQLREELETLHQKHRFARGTNDVHEQSRQATERARIEAAIVEKLRECVLRSVRDEVLDVHTIATRCDTPVGTLLEVLDDLADEGFIYNVASAEHALWTLRPGEAATDQELVALVQRLIMLRPMSTHELADATNAEGMTLKKYVEQWLAEREDREIGSAADERSRLEKYVLPTLGGTLMTDIRPRDARDLARELTKLKKANTIAPRTALHIFRTLHNVFEGAIVDEIVLNNPIKVKRGELPKKVDQDPEWRPNATYTVDEVVKLLSDTKVPVERRVLYALKALAGLRHGEAVALCWRHIDITVSPLFKINVVQAWCSRTSQVKSTKTELVRDVPIHPVLWQILQAWKSDHWERIYGRKPTKDDFIVPTRTFSCVAVKDAVEAMKRDLVNLELRLEAGKLRDRGGHDLRSWYKTRLIEDHADSLVIRRTTHAPPKDVDGGYERFSWNVMCREVAKLQITLPVEGALQLVTESLQSEVKARNRWRKVVTPLGLESSKRGRS